MDRNEDALRKLLKRALSWEDAHVSFDTVVDDVPVHLRGVKPEGLPYSLWQLVEHLRLTQFDILDFCRNPNYEQPPFENYWPSSAEPPTKGAWDKSIAVVKRDRDALEAIAVDPKIDLFAKIPHGSGQTCLRELVLVTDHTAYHVGQLVAVRRLLGIWAAS